MPAISKVRRRQKIASARSKELRDLRKSQNQSQTPNLLKSKLPSPERVQVSKAKDKNYSKSTRGILVECVICSKDFSSFATVLKSMQQRMIRFLVDQLFILAATPTNPKPHLTSTSLSQVHLCLDCSNKVELVMEYTAQVKQLEYQIADLSNTFKDLVTQAISGGSSHRGSEVDAIVHQIRNFIAELPSQLTKTGRYPLITLPEPDLREPTTPPTLQDDLDFEMDSDVEINPSNDERIPYADKHIQEATYVEHDEEDFVFEDDVKIKLEETDEDALFMEEGSATSEPFFIQPEPPDTTDPLFCPLVDPMQNIMETEIYPVLKKTQRKETSINPSVTRDKTPTVLINRLSMPHGVSGITRTRSKLKRANSSITANTNLDNPSSSEEEKEASAESSKLESSSSEEEDSDSIWKEDSQKGNQSPKNKLKKRIRPARNKKYVHCCMQKFLRKSQELRDHFSTAHETLTQFTCLTCSSVFISVFKLRQHTDELHSATPFSFQCNTCQKTLESIEELKRCKMIHEVNNKVASYPRNSSIPFQCNRCHIVFSDEDALTSHISSAFERDNFLQFSCQTCLKSLYTVKQVQCHMKKVHPEVFRAKCLLCDDIPVLTSFEEVTDHQQIVHPHFATKAALEVIFKAQTPAHYLAVLEDKREKSFPRQSQYKPILVILPDIDEKLPCPDENCNVVCKNKKLLAYHRIMNHGRWHNPDFLECKICQKRFEDIHGINIHMVSHSNERPVVCSQCGDRFKLEAAMRRHVKAVHNKERNNACGTCGKGFFSKTKLRIHEAIHKEDRPFLCSECGKSFKTKNNLYIHGWSHDPNRKHKYPVYMPKAVRSKKKKAGKDEKVVDKSDLLEPSCPVVPPAESSSSISTAISIPAHPPIPEVTTPSFPAYGESSESVSREPDPELSIPTVLYDADNRVPYPDGFLSKNPSFTIL